MFGSNAHFCAIENLSFLAWGDLPLALLLGGAALLACCLAGALLHRIMRRKGSPLISFGHALSGLILFSAGFAIIWCRGLTILLPVPLLLLGWIRAKPAVPERVRGEWLAGLAGLCGFLLFYAQAFAGDAQFVKYPSGDLAYYARLADHLLRTGQESRLLDLETPATAVLQPYHWGDTWALALLSKACNIRALYALPLVLYPLLAAICGMGAFRMLRSRTKMQLLPAVVIGPMLLFIPPLAWLPASWIRSYHLLAAPVAQYPKLIIWGILGFALLEGVGDRRPRALAWLLVLAGLFNLPMLPIAVLGLAVIGWQQIRSGASRGRLLQLCGLGFCLFGWPALLYFGLSGDAPFAAGGAGGAMFRLHPGLILPVLANLGMLWPYLLMLAITYRFAGGLQRDSRRMLLAAGLALAAGAIAWGLAADALADAPQFMTSLIPLVALTIVVVCIAELQRVRRPVAAALCLLAPLAGLLAHHRFSKDTYLTDRLSRADYERLLRVPAISRPWDSLRAVVIQSPLEPDRTATRASVIFYPLELLAFEHPHYMAASLQAPYLADVPAGAANAAESAALKWHTPVMQFAHSQGLSAVPPAMQVFWYVKEKQPDILIIAHDAAVPRELAGFLGPDSVRLQSKPYRVLSLYYGMR